jgi:hypothetical protein
MFCAEYIPVDAKDCHKQAKRFLKLAGEATDPDLRESLTETAVRWQRLAADFETHEERGEPFQTVRHPRTVKR